MTHVLVTGAGGSAATNFIRCLRMGDPGIGVIGVDVRPEHLHCAPVDHRYLVPRADDPRYAEALNAIIARHDVQVVHPQPDVEVLALARLRDQVLAATLLPDLGVVELCQSKLECQLHLQQRGVPVPKIEAAPSRDALPDAIERLLTDGNDRVWVRATHGAGSKAALPVRTAGQAESWIDYWSEFHGLAPSDFMLAEYLPGVESAFQSLWFEGDLVTSAARERVSYLFGHLTPSGQTSTPAIARSVHDAEVNDVAVAAVRAVDPRPHGVYCVDLKRNVHGVPCVMEINAGRFFTTSNFFAEAGANMPWSYLQLALGASPGELSQLDAVPSDLHWVRGIDMPATLVRGEWNVLPVPS